MSTPVGSLPQARLDEPVFDAEGQLLGYVAAIGTRHGELCRIGIEDSSVAPTSLRFVRRDRFTVEADRIVLKS